MTSSRGRGPAGTDEHPGRRGHRQDGRIGELAASRRGDQPRFRPRTGRQRPKPRRWRTKPGSRRRQSVRLLYGSVWWWRVGVHAAGLRRLLGRRSNRRTVAARCPARRERHRRGRHGGQPEHHHAAGLQAVRGSRLASRARRPGLRRRDPHLDPRRSAAGRSVQLGSCAGRAFVREERGTPTDFSWAGGWCWRLPPLLVRQGALASVCVLCKFCGQRAARGLFCRGVRREQLRREPSRAPRGANTRRENPPRVDRLLRPSSRVRPTNSDGAPKAPRFGTSATEKSCLSVPLRPVRPRRTVSGACFVRVRSDPPNPSAKEVVKVSSFHHDERNRRQHRR